MRMVRVPESGSRVPLKYGLVESWPAGRRRSSLQWLPVAGGPESAGAKRAAEASSMGGILNAARCRLFTDGTLAVQPLAEVVAIL